MEAIIVTKKKSLLSNVCKLPLKVAGLAIVVGTVTVVGAVAIIASTLDTKETTTIRKL